MDEFLPVDTGKAEVGSSSAADTTEQEKVAGLKRAKKLNAAIDALSSGIGKGFTTLLRNPGPVKREQLSTLEKGDQPIVLSGVDI